MAGNAQFIDMTGRKFGILTVIRREGTYRNTTRAAWLCRCRCGVEKVVAGDNLRLGRQVSCGCSRGGKVTHGLAGESIYNVWVSMLARCNNPNNTAFKNYGGRGIRVCERWEKFENFLEDMGIPKKGLTIDRFPNNNGNYEPGNCRWATLKEQANNKRTNVVIQTSIGKLSITEAAKVAGMTIHGIRKRMEQGRVGDSLIAKKRQGRH